MMLGRPGIGIALVLAVLVLPPGATAQQAAKAHRIGILAGGTGAHPAFFQCLRDLGLVEGENLSVDRQYARGHVYRLPDLAVDLLRRQVEVIVAVSNQEVQAARQATTSVPIVMAFGAAAVEVGLVASLARPGGNITGAIAQAPETAGRMLELLKEAVPQAARIALLWNPDAAGMTAYHAATQAAAEALGVTLRSFDVRRPADFPPAFLAIPESGVQALLVAADVLVLAHRRQILEFAAHHRLPAIYSLRLFVEDGGLMSYAASVSAQWCTAAQYVQRILKGAKPADLPVQGPGRFEFLVNRRAARAMGLALPPALLGRADQVIE